MSTNQTTDETLSPVKYTIKCTDNGLFLCITPGDEVEFINTSEKALTVEIRPQNDTSDGLIASDEVTINPGTPKTPGIQRSTVLPGKGEYYKLKLKGGLGEPMNGTITVSRGT
ncbi:hypothetical protein [Myxococcus xanthus]|uniref:hypothetical protein n=1 Tax=Myxococcus xanthus TaxID=34 RepID=UPI00112CFB80|nr:hypothetical protein [Myxococcus xanthus]